MSREVRAALIVAIIIAAIMGGCAYTPSGSPSPTPGSTTPSAAQYAGTWLNDNPLTPDIPKLIISNVGQTLSIHAYSACTPTYCDWGTVSRQFTGEPLTITFVFDGSRPDACCTGMPTVQLTITFDTADQTKLMVVSTRAASTLTNIMHKA